jgi:hypothetical protein
MVLAVLTFTQYLLASQQTLGELRIDDQKEYFILRFKFTKSSHNYLTIIIFTEYIQIAVRWAVVTGKGSDFLNQQLDLREKAMGLANLEKFLQGW